MFSNALVTSIEIITSKPDLDDWPLLRFHGNFVQFKIIFLAFIYYFSPYYSSTPKGLPIFHPFRRLWRRIFQEVYSFCIMIYLTYLLLCWCVSQVWPDASWRNVNHKQLYLYGESCFNDLLRLRQDTSKKKTKIFVISKILEIVSMKRTPN